MSAATIKPQYILVTGCSAGGIGAALALNFASRGYHVFATVRNKNKLPPELAFRFNVTALELDVTNKDSIANAVRTVNTITEDEGLDVLVNNAAVSYALPILDADLEEARRVFDTNLWGMLAVMKAFIDLLEMKRGKIVNISSVAAELNTPWFGTAFKFHKPLCATNKDINPPFRHLYCF
jgi:NAD(P)-dependent dehydrogenase (short-subunit alcohol dehydrogenase family)